MGWWAGPVQAVNPARAGMIRVRRIDAATAACKPRASGDDPTTAAVAAVLPE